MDIFIYAIFILNGGHYKILSESSNKKVSNIHPVPPNNPITKPPNKKLPKQNPKFQNPKSKFKNKQSFRQRNSFGKEEQIYKIKSVQLINIFHLIKCSNCTFYNISSCIHINFVTFFNEEI